MKKIILLLTLLLPAGVWGEALRPYVSVKAENHSARYTYSRGVFNETFKDRGWNFVPAAGIAWNHIRAELEYNQKELDDNGAALNVLGQSVTQIDVARIRRKSLMINAYYDWLAEETNQIFIYAGGGAGISRLNADMAVNAVNYSYSDSKNSFSWALYAGLTAKIETPALPLFLDAGYRYFQAQGFNSDKLKEKGFTAGFRYMF